MNLTRRKVLWTILAGSLAVLVLGVCTLLYWMWSTGQDTKAIARDMRATQEGSAHALQLIEECVTPGGPCHRHSIAIETMAAYCADQPGWQTVEQLERCVNRLLNQPHDHAHPEGRQ